MRFRRHRAESAGDPDDEEAGAVESTGAEVDDSEAELESLELARPHGPWDRAETDRDTREEGYVDFGGLVVPTTPELEIHVQLDEQSGLGAAILLVGPESAVELRAFAAPRTEGIWDDVRKEVAAEAARAGGTATEIDGEWGIELECVVPVQLEDGQQATQPARIVGVDGPRWLLRGTFYGRSAAEADPDGVVERTFRDTIVVRGDAAMLPREQIPLSLPPGAEPASGPNGVPPTGSTGEQPPDR